MSGRVFSDKSLAVVPRVRSHDGNASHRQCAGGRAWLVARPADTRRLGRPITTRRAAATDDDVPTWAAAADERL
jgi:hypothetical protein